MITEVGPKSNSLREAERIVGLWFAGLWAERPAWLNRMPDREDVDVLVNAIAAQLDAVELKTRPSIKPSGTVGSA